MMRPRSRAAIETCTLQLHSWNPFKAQPAEGAGPPLKPGKRPCHSDRSTADIALLDLSALSLADDGPRHRKIRVLPFLERKRRRHAGGSRSISGRSSERSGKTRRHCRSVGGSHATCSDLALAAGGTDSSGEMFLNWDGSWGSDASEARVARRESKEVAGALEREGLTGFGVSQGTWVSVEHLQANESGYDSETGYKGDAEFGYEDELDEEEEDPGGKTLFWRTRFGDVSAFPEMKSHPRCRRRKQDPKMATSEREE